MLTRGLGGGDAILVTTAGDVVYSADKRVDFGTNLLDGPYVDSPLAAVLRDQLPRVRSGSALMADLDLYVPADGGPVFFAAAAVKNDTETIGAVAIEIPVSALSAITTTNQQWEQYGLQSGESYVVGSDGILRSESRLWIEDREAYLDKVDGDLLAGLIEGLGSPIGIQLVDTRPVETAFDGEEFRGTSTNYLGTRNFSYAQSIDVPGVEWAVVVDVPLSDARSPLYDYARRLGVVLLVILPTAALARVVAGAPLDAPDRSGARRRDGDRRRRARPRHPEPGPRRVRRPRPAAGCDGRGPRGARSCAGRRVRRTSGVVARRVAAALDRRVGRGVRDRAISPTSQPSLPSPST